MHRRLWRQYQQAEAHVGGNINEQQSLIADEDEIGETPSTSKRIQPTMTGGSGKLSSMNPSNQPFTGMTAINNLRNIEMNLKELHDVCRSILDKFVVDGAPLQVNLPGKMRIEVETLYREWVFGNTNNSNNINNKTNQPPELIIDHSDSFKYIQSIEDIFDSASFVKVKDIFKRSKKEVYDLLKKDTYARLKLTTQFQEFIASVIPNPSSKKSHQEDKGSLISISVSPTAPNATMRQRSFLSGRTKG